MRHFSSIWALLSLTFTCAGCGASPDVDPGPAPPSRPEAIEPPWKAQHPSVPVPWPASAPPDLLASTKSGDLVLVDGATGAVKQTVPAPAHAQVSDLVYDPNGQRAFVAESDDHAVGAIASYAVHATPAGPLLGPRVPEVAVGGEVRLVPTPLGAVAIEGSGEPTWRLLPGGVGARPTVAGPRAMSAWATAGASGATVQALAYGPSSGELDAVSAAIVGGALEPASVTAFSVSAGSLPPSARLVPAPDRGGALLVDISGSVLSVRRADGAALGPPLLVPLGAPGLRIEAAASLRGGAVVALLLSGITEVVAIAVDKELGAASLSLVPLPGDPTPSAHLLSHDLAALGDEHVVAATDAGVFSLRVWTSGSSVGLALEGGFAGGGLRGPVAPLWPAPK